MPAISAKNSPLDPLASADLGIGAANPPTIDAEDEEERKRRVQAQQQQQESAQKALQKLVTMNPFTNIEAQ